MTLRIGILGAADIAPKAVIEPAAELNGVQVAAVAARDPKRAEAFANAHDIPRVLDTYRDVIDDPEVDIIYVPTPASLHGYWTKEAIKSGKIVLCEKPFAANAAEAKEVAQAVDDSGLIVMEAMHSLHHPLWAATKEVLNSGELGTIKSVDVEFSWPIPDRSDIRWNPDLAGGALMDMGVYPVTLLRYLFGELTVRTASAKAQTGVDGTLEAELVTSEGVHVTFKTSMEGDVEPAQFLDVTGTDGSLRLTGYVHPHNGGKLIVRTKDGVREEEASARSSYSYMLEELLLAATTGADVVTDAQSATSTMQLIDDLYTAAGLEVRTPTPIDG